MITTTRVIISYRQELPQPAWFLGSQVFKLLACTVLQCDFNSKKTKPVSNVTAPPLELPQPKEVRTKTKVSPAGAAEKIKVWFRQAYALPELELGTQTFSISTLIIVEITRGRMHPCSSSQTFKKAWSWMCVHLRKTGSGWSLCAGLCWMKRPFLQ